MTLDKDTKSLLIMGTGMVLLLLIYAASCAAANQIYKKNLEELKAKIPCLDPDKDAEKIARASAEQWIEHSKAVVKEATDIAPSADWSDYASGDAGSAN
jgi:hypothetical protein